MGLVQISVRISEQDLYRVQFHTDIHVCAANKGRAERERERDSDRDRQRERERDRPKHSSGAGKSNCNQRWRTSNKNLQPSAVADGDASSSLASIRLSRCCNSLLRPRSKSSQFQSTLILSSPLFFFIFFLSSHLLLLFLSPRCKAFTQQCPHNFLLCCLKCPTAPHFDS